MRDPRDFSAACTTGPNTLIRVSPLRMTSACYNQFLPDKQSHDPLNHSKLMVYKHLKLPEPKETNETLLCDYVLSLF